LTSNFYRPSHFQKGILVSILKVSQIFQELGLRKLGEMGKLIYSDNEVINLCELLRPTFKL
jgi:hypothetical protein